MLPRPVGVSTSSRQAPCLLAPILLSSPGDVEVAIGAAGAMQGRNRRGKTHAPGSGPPRVLSPLSPVTSGELSHPAAPRSPCASLQASLPPPGTSPPRKALNFNRVTGWGAGNRALGHGDLSTISDTCTMATSKRPAACEARVAALALGELNCVLCLKISLFHCRGASSGDSCTCSHL